MRDHVDELETHPGGWWGRLVEWSFQPRILFTIVLAMLFVVVIPAIPSMWPAIGQSPVFQFSSDKIDLSEPTEWVPHGIARQIALSHPEWKERNLLDSSLAADLAGEFRKHPWIASVDRVEKTRQGRVKIDVTYRNPVAVVETALGLVSVDADGFVLPAGDIRPSDWDRLPRLKGIHSLATGQTGKRWNDPLVVSGAKLCAALLPKGNIDTLWKKYGLQAVVAPDRRSASPDELLLPPVFELQTLLERRILWGHPPDVDSHEPSTTKKLENLAAYVKRYKSLDLPIGNLILENRRMTGIKLLSSRTVEPMRQSRQDSLPR